MKCVLIDIFTVLGFYWVILTIIVIFWTALPYKHYVYSCIFGCEASSTYHNLTESVSELVSARPLASIESVGKHDMQRHSVTCRDILGNLVEHREIKAEQK